MDVTPTCHLAGIVAHLGPVLLLLHGQDGCLRAGGHALLWLFEGRGQANVAADEAHHVVDERVDAQRAAQVQVRLFVGVRRTVAPLAAQFGPEPGFGQGVRGAVEETWGGEETSLSDDLSNKGRVLMRNALPPLFNLTLILHAGRSLYELVCDGRNQGIQ